MHRRLPAVFVLCLSMAACAQTPRGHSAPVPPETDPTMPAPATPPAASTAPPAADRDALTATCNAAGAQSFVGRTASADVVAGAKTASGATGAVRVVKPGQMVTMDFRGDRLNIRVDDKNTIVSITCG